MIYIAALSFGTFFLGCLLQVAIWRFKNPQNHFKALVTIFTIILVTSVFVLISIDKLIYSLMFAQCFGLLALSYISFYSLIEGQSPSLVLVMAVYARRKKGLSLNEANQLLASEDIIGIRLQELERDKLIWMSDQGYQLTPRGHLLGGLFHCGRLILHLDKGG
jgi:hypothetical protein